MVDEATRRVVSEIPLLKTGASPRDKELWVQRLKEEYQALIKVNGEGGALLYYAPRGQEACQRFRNTAGVFYVQIPVTYPATAPEIAIPELDGKTAKMYRGGKICLTEHFKPLWARNVPKLGLAHLMALGLGPWLAVEIPDLISKGLIKHKDN
ncbi:ubiquitin-fold modifier-conjugating enzyme 1 [Pyxicephalus adspersus]|uniref:ubiquitin-fold modifier-conjugating enzyme 1 n=1 Tax=Pyxicephalus adspersus TaxID=30357 RepID=UPI003B5C51B5